MQEILIKIKDSSDNLVKKLGFEAESIVSEKDGTIYVNIQADNPALLIGRGGDVVWALQHVLRLILESEMENSYSIILDVAGYRSKKSENIERKAREKAFLVLSTGIAEIMPPMTSFERRIVHITCANITDIETESEGEGMERRVVIKPKKS